MSRENKSLSKTAFVAGGSSGVGLSLVKKLLHKGYLVFFCARNQESIEEVSRTHLSSYSGRFYYQSTDLSLPEFNATQLINLAQSKMGSINQVFIVAGATHNEDHVPSAENLIAQVHHQNFLGQAKILNTLCENYKKLCLENIIICSSIAAAAPRKNNLIYSSAKSALETYAQGCRHYLFSKNICFQIYRLGFVKTRLTEGKSLLLPPVTPDRVALYMLKNLDKDIGIVYYPVFWKYIILILKSLPWFIYKKLNF